MAAATAAVALAEPRVRRAFYAFAAIGALFFGVLFFGVPSLITTWFDADPEGHRIHNLSHGITSGFLITGAFLLQLRGASRKVALMQQAIIVVGFLLVPFLVFSLTSTAPDQAISGPAVFILIAVAAAVVAIPAALHPARAALFTRGPVSVPLLVLAAAAGLAAAYYAAGQVGLQFTAPIGDIHARDGHYIGAGSAALAIAAVALLASLRTPGWRISAWMAGIAAMLYGLAGMLYPDLLSSLGSSAGAATILVGIAFIVLAERESARR